MLMHAIHYSILNSIPAQFTAFCADYIVVVVCAHCYLSDYIHFFTNDGVCITKVLNTFNHTYLKGFDLMKAC